MGNASLFLIIYYFYYNITKDYPRKEPEMKRYMVPRVSHCKSGCRPRSWVRSKTAFQVWRARLFPRQRRKGRAFFWGRNGKPVRHRKGISCPRRRLKTSQRRWWQSGL